MTYFELIASPYYSNSNTTWAPAIKIQETAEIILAEVPVIDAKNMDVEVSQSSIKESMAMKSTQKRALFRPEFHHGCFNALFPYLHLQNDQVKAEFKDGILTLTMPKVLAQRKAVVMNQQS